MALVKYIGAPHEVEFCSIPDEYPNTFRDGREWTGGYQGTHYRYRLAFSTAAGPRFAGYAVCLGEADEEPTLAKPVKREVFTVYLTSGQKCTWPQNKPEELRVITHDDGSLHIHGPRDIPSSIFAKGEWTHCGVRIVEQPS